MYHSLLWSLIVLLTVGVHSSNHGVFYSIWISMRRFRKSVVRPSVYTAKNAYSSIINSKIIFAYQGKGIGILYKKMKRSFQKKKFSQILEAIFEKVRSCLLLLRYWQQNDILHIRCNGLFSIRKLNVISEKNNFQNLDGFLVKN